MLVEEKDCDVGESDGCVRSRGHGVCTPAYAATNDEDCDMQLVKSAYCVREGWRRWPGIGKGETSSC